MTTAEAFERLVALRGKQDGLLSLGEILGDPPLQAGLLEWAGQAHEVGARLDRRRFGLCFLAAAAIVAREKAAEHRLWPHLAEAFPAAPDLFDLNKQPRYDLRLAIEDATSAFALRNVLHRGASDHRWYLTILLQCGFTRRNLERLPFWLSGLQPLPLAATLLIDDPLLGSESFARAWKSLRAFRSGTIPEIPPSPWLPGELLSTARRHARERLDLGTASPGVDTRIALAYAGHARPEFRIHYVLPDSLASERTAHVDIAAGDESIRVLRKADDTFADPDPLIVPVVGSGRAAAALARGEVVVEVHSASRSLLHREVLRVFSPDEDVDVFIERRQGEWLRAADPFTAAIPPRASIVLRAADDLELRGVPSAAAVSIAGSRWYRIAASDVDRVELRLSGEPLWKARPSEQARACLPYELAFGVEPYTVGSDVVWSSRATSGASADLRIVRGRVGRNDLRVERNGPGGFRLVLPSEPGRKTLPATFRARLQVEAGGRRHLATAILPAPDARRFYVRSPTGIDPLQIRSWEALARPVRYVGASAESWLLEGERPVLPLDTRDVDLQPELAGIGAELAVVPQRFNWEPEDRKVLAVSLVDVGMLLGLADEGRGIAQLELEPRALSLAEELEVDLLRSDGSIVTRSLKGGITEGESVLVDSSAGTPALGAALRHRDKCLGRVGGPELARAVSAWNTDERRFRAGLYWAFQNRLPVARTDVRDALDVIVRKHPLWALRFSFGRDLNSVLRGEEVIRGFWRSRLRLARAEMERALVERGYETVLEHAEAELEPAHEGDDEYSTLQLAFLHLVRVDPITAGIVLRQGLRRSGQHGMCERTLRGLEAWVRDAASYRRTSAWAEALGVDEAFLRESASRAAVVVIGGQALTSRDHLNLTQILYYGEMRALAAVEIVQALLAQAQGGRPRAEAGTDL